MSHALMHGTKPAGLEVKTHGDGTAVNRNTIYLGDYEISMEDFLAVAAYVLTNTDLIDANDPRLQFVKCVQAMQVMEGPYGRHLRSHIPAVPRSNSW